MKQHWLRRKELATDVVSDRIAIRYRELIEAAVRKLISEELEGASGGSCQLSQQGEDPQRLESHPHEHPEQGEW